MNSQEQLYRKIEKMQLAIDTLTAEVGRLADYSASLESQNDYYKAKYSECLELLKVSECGKDSYQDIQKRGEWIKRKAELLGGV